MDIYEQISIDSNCCIETPLSRFTKVRSSPFNPCNNTINTDGLPCFALWDTWILDLEKKTAE